ncbi:hypothetical protein POM88_042451 [Heracleum sosnowskyi]|uniref:Secreted protein n=1 Tax=Heracleum sosnowskyi TaxID=360622 RepID=A0AAD8HGC1_9APIA|nr:hypothetical protein POM88_042451 [Heracleum sosnowskyi]
MVLFLHLWTSSSVIMSIQAVELKVRMFKMHCILTSSIFATNTRNYNNKHTHDTKEKRQWRKQWHQAFPSNEADQGAATSVAKLVVSPKNSSGGVSSAVQSLMFKLASGPSKRGRGH